MIQNKLNEITAVDHYAYNHQIHITLEWTWGIYSTEELEFGITEFTHDLQTQVVDPSIIPK